MTLLQQRDDLRKERRLKVYSETRALLRRVLAERLPGFRVVVFGSLTKPGQFHDRSDIDLALFEEPQGSSFFSLVSELQERMGRRVDLVLLDRCRLREKILREGEVWMP